MEGFFLILILIGFMILYSFIKAITLGHKSSTLKERLNDLEKRVAELENLKTTPAQQAEPQTEIPIATIPKEEVIPQAPAQTIIIPIETKPKNQIKTEIQTQEVKPEKQEKEYPKQIQKPLIPRPKEQQQSAYWNNLEKQFIDNWIGILGSIAVVMGAVFISIYAALKMEPVYRFWMLIIFAVLLFMVFMVLRAKTKWLKLSVWLRSISLAVLLYACLGAGGITGLKWINSPLYAVIVLLVGVSCNLIVGTWTGSQFFASFHTILSLTVLSLAPQSPLTMVIATGICFMQIILTYRERWEYHLMVSITLFLAYQLYWAFMMDIYATRHIAPDIRWAGIMCTALIGISTMFVHYREVYSAKNFERLPFQVHLINWIFMGVGFLLYSTGSKWNTFVLMIASLSAFLLARRGKKLNMRWLFVTDTLIAELIALLAIATLPRWQFSYIPIASVLLLEVMLFLWLMIREKDSIISRVGIILYHLSGMVLIVATFGMMPSRIEGEVLKETWVLLGALIIYTGFALTLARLKNESFDSCNVYGLVDDKSSFSISGFLSGLLGIALLLLIDNTPWFTYPTALILLIFLELRRRFLFKGFNAGTHLMVLAAFIIAWKTMWTGILYDTQSILFYGLPFFFVAYIGARTSAFPWLEKHWKYPWIYLFSIHLAIYSYTLFNPLSTLAPGTIWLILALVYWELAQFIAHKSTTTELQKKGELQRYLWHWGYWFMALFLIRHWTHHIYAGIYYLAGYKTTLWIELLALAIMIYWALTTKPTDEKEYKSWQTLHPLMWELILIFAFFTITLEIPDLFYPLIWITGAIILFFIGRIALPILSRFRFYALLFYWATAFHIAFISTTDQMPVSSIFQQKQFQGLFALLLQLVLLILFYYHLHLETVHFPKPVHFFQNLVNKIQQRKNIWIYYPYFIAAAFFLYWSFNRALLTLFWVIEAFVIFSLSLVLRENHFRYVSMIGLAACLVRLVFYDLARSSTIARAFVFLGVGAIMLLMNTLYTKYRGRFRNE